MNRRGAAIGSAAFALGQPGVVAGLIPYWITGGWNGTGAPLALQVAGATLLVAARDAVAR